MTEGGIKMIQGVREVFEIVDLEIKRDSPPQGVIEEQQDSSKVILIGRGLQRDMFQKSLNEALN